MLVFYKEVQTDRNNCANHEDRVEYESYFVGIHGIFI